MQRIVFLRYMGVLGRVLLLLLVVGGLHSLDADREATR